MNEEKKAQKMLINKAFFGKGLTDCGGCIEVFTTQEEALKRDKHLGIFSVSGSHKVIGTVIVRTSYELSQEDQVELESRICKAFLGISPKVE